jgi:DNA-binding transcriptional MocR family regulator
MDDVPARYVVRGRTASEIAGDLESAVRGGRLAPGEQLPTVRGLAGQLDVSPSTVSAAYQSLRDRGVVTADGRRGTRVAERPPLPLARQLEVGNAVDLATGNPDPALLPDLAAVLREVRYAGRLYTNEHNDPELIRLARRQFDADGIPAKHLTAVGGALDGVERALAAHTRPGDRIAVEDPGYAGVIELVRAMGLRLQPVTVDGCGMVPAALAGALRRGAAAVVLTPRAQNPTGAALDPARVTALRKVLRTHPDALIVEDDHAGPVAGSAALTVCTARTSRWAVVRSVSKSLGPDLRLAVLAGDEVTVGRVLGRLSVSTGWVSHVLQHLVVALWRDREVGRLLVRAQSAYTERRGALVDALAGHSVPAYGRSGLNVWVPVPEELSIVQHMRSAGYAVAAGARYRLGSAPGIRITAATLSPTAAPAVAAALAVALSPSAHARSG